MKTNLTSTLAAVSLWTLTSSLPVPAQTVLYWDSDTSSANGFGGGGVTAAWNAASARWYNGTANVAWLDGSVAVFAGSASGNPNIFGTTFNPVAHSLVFSNVSNYLITSAAAPRLTVTSGNIYASTDSTIDAKITNAVGDITTGIRKLGPARLSLTGNNPFLGGLSVLEGTLVLNNKQAIGGASQPLTVNGGILELTGVQSVSERALIVGNNHATIGVVSSGDAWGFQNLQGANGTLTKVGAGQLSFTGTNVSSRTGATIVSEGTLAVSNTLGSAIGTGAVTVKSGAMLTGTGIVGGPVTVEDGGILAPGTSPGTLTLQSDLNLAATAQLNFDLDTPGVIGSGVNDWIDIAGNLTLDGTVNLTGLANFGAGTYELMAYDGTLLDNGLLLGALSGTANNSFNYEFQAGGGEVNLIVSLVPEPQTWALGLVGMALVAALRKRRSRNERRAANAL